MTRESGTCFLTHEEPKMIRCLSIDKRTLEFRFWPKWMMAVEDLASDFAKVSDDPFGYNETASVSLLCSAAARCGYLALAEYATTKRGRDDKRERAAGRCDMYLLAENHDWEFEFKQFYPWSVPRRRLDSWWGAAVDSARCLDGSGAERSIAGLVVNFYNLEPKHYDRARSVLIEFATKRQFAWHLTSRQASVTDTFIFMERV